MTTFRLEFLPSATKEWNKLGVPIREQFKKKLTERLNAPRVVAARLTGLPDCYKIKLRSVGYRLIYRVVDETVTVSVIAVGRRDRDEVYVAAAKRV